MFEDLEERIRRLELGLNGVEEPTWPDVSSEPEPLPWPDQSAREPRNEASDFHTDAA